MSAPASSARVAPARRCAYTVLRRVFEDGAYADRALHGEAKELDARDRALAMRLAYGAVQRKGTLDFLIERLAERPAGAAGRAAAGGAAAGAVRAAVSSAARPTTRSSQTGWSWRRAARAAGTGWSTRCCGAPRARARALLAELGDETPAQAAVKHSHPEWIARLWWE